MKILSVNVWNDFNLFLYGDTHVGSTQFYEKGFAKMVDMVTSEYAGLPAERNKAISHGDDIEAILVDDPRFDFQTTKESSILAQMHYVEKIETPLVPHLIGKLNGNHPHKLKRFGDLTQEICKRLDVPYLTYSAVIDYHVQGKTIFKHFVHHGFGTINSIIDNEADRLASMHRSLRRKFNRKFKDCSLHSMGHTHKLMIVEPVEKLALNTAGNKIKSKYYKDGEWYINTGSFYRTFMEGDSNYAEIAGYDPVELGFVVVRIRDKQIAGVDKIVL